MSEKYQKHRFKYTYSNKLEYEDKDLYDEIIRTNAAKSDGTMNVNSLYIENIEDIEQTIDITFNTTLTDVDIHQIPQYRFLHTITIPNTVTN